MWSSARQDLGNCTGTGGHHTTLGVFKSSRLIAVTSSCAARRRNISAANYASEVVRALVHVGLRKRAFSTLSHARLQVKTTYRTTKGYPAGIFPVVPLCRLGSVWTRRGMQYCTLPTRIAGAATGKGPASFLFSFLHHLSDAAIGVHKKLSEALRSRPIIMGVVF